MRRCLHFWNDISLFTGLTTQHQQIDYLFCDFFSRISANSEHDFIYYSDKELNIWRQLVTGFSDALCVGTRPSIIMKNKETICPSIFPQRTRDEMGRTIAIQLSEHDNDTLKKLAQESRHIYIVEDIVVCGLTLKYIISKLCEFGCEKISISTFISNTNSIAMLNTLFNNHIDISCQYSMNGIPIDESTCICAFDVLNGKIKGMSEQETYEKLTLYCGEYTNDFLDVMRKTRIILNDD